MISSKCSNSKQLLFNRKNQVVLFAAYSRSSSNAKSPYKIVQAKIKDATKDEIPHENGLNWEFFAPRNNRFFLREGSIGPAYISARSTFVQKGFDLNELVDFSSADSLRLHIKIQKCPVLLSKNLHELFPAPEVIVENNKLTLITLSQADDSLDYEKSAINFVHAAREICSQLRQYGHWADFLNPMSGKSFFNTTHQQKHVLNLDDEKFRGLTMKLEEIRGVGADHNCLLLQEDKSAKFSGSIFSNIPPSLDLIQELTTD